MNYYLKAFRNYAVFDGRAGFFEFWAFVLYNIVFSVSAFILDILLNLDSQGILQHGLIYEIYTAIVFIPGMAVAVRRLHDVGKDGWYIFIVLIPFVGIIRFFMVVLGDSYPGKNDYGDKPIEAQRSKRFKQRKQV